MTKSERSPQVDLHGLRPADALRRLAQALHTARVRGAGELLVITGQGWGNRLQEPALRKQVETWLRAPEGRRAGALATRKASSAGALIVELRR